MTDKTIPIFYACDDRFAKYTLVSLYSIIKNASRARKYEVHILHTNVSREMIEKTMSLENENFKIEFNDVTDYLSSIEETLPIRDYYSKTTYFRMFIANMFPRYDKVIYIDGDTIVKADISELFDTDIGDSIVGACHEQAMVQTDEFGTYAERVVGISRHSFFNAGVLLINSEEWRSRNLLDKFLTLLAEYRFVVTQDEDYLNILCKDRVHWLNQRWNTEVAEQFTYPYNVEDAYVIHYIMTNKPWHYESCRAAKEFWHVAEQTAVYADILEQLRSYTDDNRRRDEESCANLRALAVSETENPSNYLNMLNKKKRAPDRVAVVQKIEQYEKDGRFDLDIEDDPPSKVLLPDGVDYFCRGPVAKIKRKISHVLAKRFLKKIQQEKKMIIGEVVGLENLQSLSSGAVITCNHFNPFDTFAVHEAFLRSGIKKRKLYRVIREGNYTSFPGFYGFLMRNFYTLPLSSDRRTMHKFSMATDKILRDGNLILIYPEQSMWWNYRKPKPLKPGAYSIAMKADVPILPIFITMRDTDILGEDGYPIEEYTVNIGRAICPDESLPRKERLDKMMEENRKVWEEIYVNFYDMPIK